MNDRGTIRDRTLVLRILVPGLETRLRDKMKEQEEQAAADKESYLDLDGVTCEPTTARNRTLWNFHCDGATYPAKLVNLPCPVELHKTHDHAAYFKCSDVAQMLIVYEDDMALEEAEEKAIEGFPSYYHSGLTPPMKRVVERRFAAREHKAAAPPRVAVADVEEELVTLMDNICKDEKTKRSKVPSLTTANKTLVEVEEVVVDYEPWMDDFGQQPHGVELEADQLCKQHPEVWLSPEIIRETKEQAQAARQKKQAAVAAKKEEKENGPSQKKGIAKKKGIASKKKEEQVDDITQAAIMLHRQGDNFGDFNDFDLDMNFDDDFDLNINFDEDL